MFRFPCSSNVHATRFAAFAAVRFSGKGALSSVSIVTFSCVHAFGARHMSTRMHKPTLFIDYLRPATCEFGPLFRAPACDQSLDRNLWRVGRAGDFQYEAIARIRSRGAHLLIDEGLDRKTGIRGKRECSLQKGQVRASFKSQRRESNAPVAQLKRALARRPV